jgi:release factor glutamine methyltransferase
VTSPGPTIGESLAAAIERLRRGSVSPRADASRLLEAIVGRDAGWLLAHANDELDPIARARFEIALVRRELGEPVAYVIGTAGFFGRTFAVNPTVLVPRPETEQLVELALDRLRLRPHPSFCDVGTGSGILAITLACELPAARGAATDISPAALAVARENAAELGVADRIDFYLGDLLEPATGRSPFDCIVANLPYVPTTEIAAAPDPTSFEPRLALDGGPAGLDLYRRLLPSVAGALRPGGAAFFEAGPATAGALAALAAAACGPAATVAIHRDYAGLERTVAVSMP